MCSSAITMALQILGGLAAAGAGTARPLMAIIFGNLVNLYNSKNEKDEMARLRHEIDGKVLLLLAIFIGQWALVCTYGILFSIAAMRYTMRLRALYLKAVVSQDLEQVSESNAATDLSTNASIIEDALAEKSGTILQAASTVVTSVVISFYWSWRLTLGLVSVVVVLVLKDIITATIDGRLEKKIQAVEAEATAIAEECISGIRTVTACRATSKFGSRYADMLRKARKIAFRKSPVVASQYAITYFAVLSTYSLAFWYGTRLLEKGQIDSGGAICIVLISLNTGMNALRLLLPLYSVVSKARAAHSALTSVIHTEARLDPFSREGEPLDALYSRIEFHGVDFAYPSRPMVKVLKKLNVTFGAGKVTAIIGPSGCGKSSIVALLERFYDTSSGSIKINGTDIEYYNVKSLRSNIRVVQQDAVLFNDTIFNNVAHGLIGSRYNALSEREKRRLVIKICKNMQAHDFITQLPDGYDSIVGNRGSLLSGGQRQRIAIARAIISNPVILIFDESTSALDAESERLVQAAIDRVSRGRTTIVIAHKLATVKRADRIVMMKDGSVVEEGTHQSLLRTSDAYVKSWSAQNLAADENWVRDRRPFNNPLAHSSTASSMEKGLRLYSEKAEHTAECDEVIDMTKDDPMTFFQSVLYTVSGSRALQYVCAASMVVCVITGGVYPTQAIIFGNEVVSFQMPKWGMMHSVDFWSLMFFILALVSLFSFFAIGSLSSVGGTITAHVHREKYLRGLLAQPMSFFERPTNMPGYLVACLSSHPGHLQGFIVILISLTVTTVNLSSVAILGLIVNWRFALVAIFGAVPIISIAGFLRIQSQSRKSKSLSEPLIDSAQYAAEVIGNIRTVSSFAMEAEVCSMMAKKMNMSLRPFYRNIFITMPLFAFSHSGNLLGVTFSFWYAGTLLTQHKISTLDLWIIYFGIVTGAEASSEFFASANSIVHARSSSSRIARITSALTKPTATAAESEVEKPVSGSIAFDRVSFSYPNVSNTPVLYEISLEAQQGQHIAIVGPSGSGKSTIISLIERFYQPTGGQIRIGGSPLIATDIDAYRDRVSLVSQDTQLFEGSVRDNILLGVPAGEESEDAMLDAARKAHIHNFIMSLPEGYNTPCGRKGAQFSGGQRQRLAIARALVRYPSILLLDEATSALDTESEGEVKKALRDATAGRTTVAVAHRLSTIRDADRIYVLIKGRITESGTHEELMRKRGVYWRMCQKQNVE
ncbi:ABC transporter-like protein [Lentithecium fluviatile CBS 122367]|uniref:ABC transporter-like protein n=1 Tax=Lentithecium fluviatile CBS 122367 TaxID=1168545 RepID=A0A6G1J3A3_9PLEO|nr:ABC transporter-like protein [Lentithecium fluviatile CBS 122367]